MLVIINASWTVLNKATNSKFVWLKLIKIICLVESNQIVMVLKSKNTLVHNAHRMTPSQFEIKYLIQNQHKHIFHSSDWYSHWYIDIRICNSWHAMYIISLKSQVLGPSVKVYPWSSIGTPLLLCISLKLVTSALQTLSVWNLSTVPLSKIVYIWGKEVIIVPCWGVGHSCIFCICDVYIVFYICTFSPVYGGLEINQ